MGRGKATYKKRDLKVAREIAHPGDNVEIKPDGTIVIVAGKEGEASIASAGGNEWDELYDGKDQTEVR
jgi:hypothetical protein